MPSTAWLHLQAIVNRAFDDLGDLVCRLWICDGGWLGRYTEVVWPHVGKLEKRVTAEDDVLDSLVETALDRRAGLVTHCCVLRCWMQVNSEQSTALWEGVAYSLAQLGVVNEMIVQDGN